MQAGQPPAAGHAPNPAGAAAGAPLPPAFALMPAQAHAHGNIDFGTREGGDLYRTLVRCLYTDKTNLFNGKPEMLLGFLNLIGQRIREGGMEGIVTVPMVIGAAVPELRPFLTSHGIFNLQHLVQFSETFINDPVRSAQDNFMLATAIMSSINEDAAAKIYPWRGEYTIGDHVSAVCLIKIIIRETHLDSNATTRFARENLSSLDTHIKSNGYDISKLNQFVQVQLDVLHARGEHTLDLLPNLFKGYKAAVDKKFVDYIEGKEDDYDDGTLAITPQQLMVLAANKYKVLLEGKQWNAPNQDQAQILALQAQVSQLESSVQGSKANSGQGGGSSNNRATGTSNRVKFQPEPWMLVKPSDEDIKNNVSKTSKGREYWWCIHHERYTQHKSSECKLAKSGGTGGGNGGHAPTGNSGDGTPAGGSTKALQLTKALVAIASGSDE